jgi:hypothetical protein
MCPANAPDAAASAGASVEALFAGKDPVVPAIYRRIAAALRPLGPFDEQPKKTSIHVVCGTGFAGIHPRQSALILNLRLDRPLQSPRVIRSEQVSKHRHHNEVRLTSTDEVEDELTAWLREAYHLAST